MKNGGYILLLVFTAIVILVDLGCNTIFYWKKVRGSTTNFTAVSILQDVFLIVALVVFWMVLFGTYLFKAGFFSLLCKRFTVPLLLAFTYILLTFLFQILYYREKKKQSANYIVAEWRLPLFLVYIFQRLFSPLFYYSYKRAMLRMSDPRFYDKAWVAQTVGQK